MAIREHHDRTNQNIPLTSDEREKFKILGKGNLTWGVRCCYEIISVLYSTGLADLRGFFNEAEWKFMWHVMSLDLPDHATMYTQTAHLCSLIVKPENVSKVAKYYGVDAMDIRDRVWESFHPMHTFALWWRVQELKYGSGGELEDWAKF